MLIHDFSTCPRCGFKTKKSTSFTGAESEFWYECSNPKCNTYINTYRPQAHQTAVHEDNHRFIGNFGGYGSGKTTTSRQEFYKHMFLTPKGNTVVGANIAPQYEQTIKRDIEADLPREFFTGYSTQKQYWDFINGHRIMYRPYDDPNKLRSYNVSMFIMVEASEVKGEVFTQLKTRLRHMAATKPKLDDKGNVIYKKTSTGVRIPVIEYDWRKGIIESNPDSGWIRRDVLMVSSDIQKHGNIPDAYSVLASEMDPATSSHITTAHSNEYLPEGFIDNMIKNKPAWWTGRYVYGSFSYSEGLVYPSAMRYIVNTFEVPRRWKRIMAYDYGLSDPSRFIFGAVDEMNGLLYIYKEVSTTNKNIEDLAKAFFESTKDIPVGGWICSPIIDPKSGPKRDYNKKSLADHFLDFGIAFIPGHINVDARIFRLNTYFETDKIRIMDCCTNLITELRDYKFLPEARSNDALSDKPMDKNNHSINALEWITMELPADPRNLIKGIYDKMGKRVDIFEKPVDEEVPYYKHALSDEEEYADYFYN